MNRGKVIRGLECCSSGCCLPDDCPMAAPDYIGQYDDCIDALLHNAVEWLRKMEIDESLPYSLTDVIDGMECCYTLKPCDDCKFMPYKVKRIGLCKVEVMKEALWLLKKEDENEG